jgi:ribA/ribD-fused uncharacterized protein
MDVLYFYHSSKNMLPGEGVNEHVNADYSELAGIKDWRRMLSNFFVATFTVDGRQWNSVEHCFQAAKLSIADPVVGRTLELDSGSAIGVASGEEARRARRLVELSDAQLDIWFAMQSDVLRTALMAKFSQNPNLRVMLLATGDAELWHGCRGTPRHRQFILEAVRETLRIDIGAAAE